MAKQPPKTADPGDFPLNEQDQAIVPPAGGKPQGGITIVARHKTPHPLYRRAGVTLKRVPEELMVSEEQLKVLTNDSWVVIEDLKDGTKK